MKLVILAAGSGTRLQPLTADKPKCMVMVAGKSLAQWQLDAANSLAFDKVVLVKGYQGEKIQLPGITFYENPYYEKTNMVETLFCAIDEFDDDIIISYGDILYEADVLEKIANAKDEFCVAVDTKWRGYWEKRFADPLSDAESLEMDNEGYIRDIGQKVNSISAIQAQYIGLIKFSLTGLKKVISLFKKARTFERETGAYFFCPDRSMENAYMTDFLQMMIRNNFKLRAVPIERKWMEIDTIKDYGLANENCVAQNGLLKILK